MFDELKDYLEIPFSNFQSGPPNTDFQRGYLAALLEIASEFGIEVDPALVALAEGNSQAT